MKRLKLGIIGLGIGRYYLDALRQLREAEAVAVCDIDAGKLAQCGEDFGISHRYTDYRGLLADPAVEAVCVCTPDMLHCEMVTAALEAGKDVLCEKPLSLHSEECRRMMQTAERTGRKLMVGQVCRLTPSFILAKQIVDSGMLGELFFAESEYAHDYSGMGKCWRSDPANRRHPVTGGGCHAVDLLRWIAGDPTAVFAYSNRKCLVDWGCDDSAVALLKFPHDVMGKVYVSTGCKRNYTMRTVIYGTKGTVIVDNTSDTLSLFVSELQGADRLMGVSMRKIEHKLPVAVSSHNFLDELRLFADILLNGGDVTIPASEGAATVAVCEAIIRSAESGREETVRYLDR